MKYTAFLLESVLASATLTILYLNKYLSRKKARQTKINRRYKIRLSSDEIIERSYHHIYPLYVQKEELQEM